MFLETKPRGTGPRAKRMRGREGGGGEALRDPGLNLEQGSYPTVGRHRAVERAVAAT